MARSAVFARKLLERLPLAKIRSRVFRALIAFALVLVTFLFVSLLEKQNGALNPNNIRQRLKSEGLVVETVDWTARFSFCQTTADGVRACNALADDALEGEARGTPSAGTPLTFPAKDIAERLFAKHDGKVNSVVLRHELTEADKTLLKDYGMVALVMPRSVQNWVRLRLGEQRQEVHGAGLDVLFSIRSDDLLRQGAIELELDYDEFPWFGPADLPIALVERDAVAEYAALPLRQISSSNLSRQMEIGFPLLLAAMAIVLDHSLVFAYLSLYAGARALRSYIPFLVENGTELSRAMELLTYAVNGLTFAFLIIFALDIAGFTRFKARWKIALVATSVVGFLAASFFDPVFWVRVDLWSDFLGAGVAVPLCLAGLALSFRSKRKNEGNKSEIKGTDVDGGEALVSRALFTARIVLVLFAVGLHAWANGTDLFRVSAEAFKNTLDWKHTALLPCLVTAALLDVGSTAKKMLTFGKEMAAKALIERELSVGKEVQHRMLPVRRKTSERWEWRSLYFPAQALAGDWYDVRELTFADGRVLLAACVADVTGHGVGSSLATSVICSHWSLWCTDACKISAPADNKARESLLISAPRRVNDGLLALPQNEQCTAIFALIDAEAGIISFCSGGHPGILVSDGKGLRYLTSSGERLGASGVENPEWHAKTEPIAAGEVVCLYSDGIIPPGDTVSSYAAGLRRKLKKEPAPILPFLWKQFRLNRRVFRVDHEIEDDMTLLAIELKARGVGDSSGSTEVSTPVAS
jgi:hypothetical protein